MHIVMGLFYCVCNEADDSDCSVIAVTELLLGPEEKPGVSDFCLMSGTVTDLRQSFDSLFVSVLSFFCLVLLLFTSCHFSANGPFSYFFKKGLKHFSLRERPFLYGPC